MSGPNQQFAGGPLTDAIQRYFEIALFLLVLTGFVTLASTKGLDGPSTLFVAGALLLRGYFLGTRRTLLIPEQWTTVLTLAYVGFYVFDYFLLSRQFVSTTVHLVLFLTVMRLFSARRDRDHYFLAVIAFLMVLAAAVLTVDSTFLFAFSVFLLFAVATFILMEMKRTSSNSPRNAKDVSGGAATGQMAISLASIAPAILLLILIAGGAIFFLLPRLSTGYLSAFTPGGGLSTGFSDHVELGAIGEIQQSSSVVMHIHVDGDHTGDYIQKWRGMSLSDFDGTSWSDRYHPIPIRPGVNQQFDLRSRVGKQTAPLAVGIASQIHYHILMEPVGINVFFLAQQPQALQGKYRMVAMDPGGALFNIDPERTIDIYDGWSLQNPQFSSPDRAYPPEGLSRYLQVPKLDPRIPELARQITLSSASDYAKAVAIEKYLKTQFGYTLTLPSIRPADPLAYFLFDRKRGHCEYFASALAVMLRTVAIPSRVVTGFQHGEFNDITSQYVVRGSDAHAWVEAYFPDRGWVTFDPTPASSDFVHTRWGKLAMYSDAMASFWREWVVNYDAAHQLNLGQQTAHQGHRILEHVRVWGRNHYQNMLAYARRLTRKASLAPGKWTIGVLLAMLASVVLLNARRLWRVIRDLWLAARPEKAPRMAASIWYGKMLRKVARKGWRKQEAQTPVEFANSIQDDQLKRQVAEFTRRYESARFGDSAEDSRRLPELYEKVASSPR